ncbi:MAG: hypothetical protein WC780_19280 [Lentimicrobiaceae bacterium]
MKTNNNHYSKLQAGFQCFVGRELLPVSHRDEKHHFGSSKIKAAIEKSGKDDFQIDFVLPGGTSRLP